MGLKENVGDALGISSNDVTNSFLFILGTVLFYFSSGAFGFLPSPVSRIYGVLFLIFWLGYPVALHYDKKYIAENSDWKPSKWYYLGLLPSYIGVAFILYYTYKRKNNL